MAAQFERYIATSGCRSLSQLFGDTVFDLAVVETLDSHLNYILISDPFYYVSQHDRKISPVSKNKYSSAVAERPLDALCC